MKRLCSDAYGKGVVRSNQESTNLRANTKDNDVTSAETFRTAQTVTFPGHEFVRTLEDSQDAQRPEMHALSVAVSYTHLTLPTKA